MTPKHGFQPKNSVAGSATPGWIRVDLAGYSAAPGEDFDVELGSDNGLFKGFLMRAETVDDGELLLPTAFKILIRGLSIHSSFCQGRSR